MLKLVSFIFLCGVVQGQTWRTFSRDEDTARQQCGHNPAGPLQSNGIHDYCSQIVDDDTTEVATRSPWSYQPICVRPMDSEETGKLCAFTVSSLRGGTGLSIITTPDVAASLASTLQQPETSWLEKQRGTPFVADQRTPYEVKRIPNKGYGVVATATIPKDSTVMLELPVVLKLSNLSPWNYTGLLTLMHHAAKRLPAKDQRRLLQMATQNKGYILDDIFRTNSFRVSLNGVAHAGLYPEIARINHECKPNTIIRFSGQTLALEIVAYRDIQPGEEITLSYFALNLRYHQRVKAIKGWGFECSCPFCQADEETRRNSDRRRDDIEAILMAMKRRENITRDVLSRAVVKLEEIVEEEGLSAQMGDLLYLVADACLAARDLKLAREIGEEALKVQRRYAGVDNERSYEVVQLLEVLDKLEHEEASASASASTLASRS